MFMEKAILIGVCTCDKDNFEYQMLEMKELANACQIDVVFEVSQNLDHANTKYYLNYGKLEEVKRIIHDLELDLIITLDSISPAVQRNITYFLDCEVLDKTALILEIFSRRALTKESMLQVESARLKYLLPRLQGSYKHMDRQRGGSQNKGLGEKKIELDARRIESKIHTVQKQLDKIHTQRTTQRKQRKKALIKSVALTGYTNVGKSSILNGFVENDKKVLEKDMLFATLTTSTRKIETENHNVFTLSDTVGFVSDLPHTLVQAFHSTLEEAIVSDLILKVMDASDMNLDVHRQVCEETLKNIGCDNIPYLFVYNKCDNTNMDYPKRVENRIYICANEKESIDFLKTEIEKELFHMEYYYITIPYNRSGVLNYIHENGNVIKEEYKEDCIELEFSIQEALSHRVNRLLNI